MLRIAPLLCLASLALLVVPLRTASSQGPPAGAPCGCDDAGKLTFDDKDSLAGWTIAGDATIDLTKGRDGKGGALRVGPGGKALKTLRGNDAAGKVEMWVYDDGTTPEKIKAPRVGPR